MIKNFSNVTLLILDTEDAGKFLHICPSEVPLDWRAEIHNTDQIRNMKNLIHKQFITIKSDYLVDLHIFDPL